MKKTKNKQQLKKGGYYHSPTAEMIDQFSQLNTEQKLKWLADTLLFLSAVARPPVKKMWQRLRRGEEI